MNLNVNVKNYQEIKTENWKIKNKNTKLKIEK